MILGYKEYTYIHKYIKTIGINNNIRFGNFPILTQFENVNVKNAFVLVIIVNIVTV